MASRVFPFLVVLLALGALVVVFIGYGETAAAATAMVMTLATGAVTVVSQLGGNKQDK